MRENFFVLSFLHPFLPSAFGPNGLLLFPIVCIILHVWNILPCPQEANVPIECTHRWRLLFHILLAGYCHEPYLRQPPPVNEHVQQRSCPVVVLYKQKSLSCCVFVSPDCSVSFDRRSIANLSNDALRLCYPAGCVCFFFLLIELINYE